MGVGADNYGGGRRREEATRGEESRRGWWVAGSFDRLPPSLMLRRTSRTGYVCLLAPKGQAKHTGILT